MSDFDQELEQRLGALRDQGLSRQLRRVDSPQGPRLELGGRGLLNFSSNDYLGLANEPSLKEAAHRAIDRYGAGAGASRLICGSLAPHHDLEEALAAFKGTEAALCFSTGYAAALGTLGALLGKDSIVVLDKLVHASIVDAARLSGARLRIYAHNDLNDLEEILKWARHMQGSKSGIARSVRSSAILVVTESVFSMDGDQAPLRELVELKERYGAWLMLDEAHATGLYGPSQRGLAEEVGVAERIEIQMGTLGKALGAAGGYIAGSRALVDLLVNQARTFIFSTAPVPAAVAAASAGLRFVRSPAGPQRRKRLWDLVTQARTFPGLGACPTSAILPLLVGAEAKAVQAAARLHQQGLYIPAIRYPSVARGAARLRLTLTAVHTAEDLAQLQTGLASLQEFIHSPPPCIP
jgi:8-amino-7-oxononanoate synthase